MSETRLNLKRYISGSIVFYLALAGLLVAVNGQTGTWNNGNGGVGAWSNAQTGGGMHPPGSLSSQDPQYSYGYAGVDSRGTYGGAGGNGGYYVSGTDEHGRPFSYNGQGQPGQPGYNMGGRLDPGYPGSYGYRGGAATITHGRGLISLGVAVTLALGAALLGRRS
ncbi:glycine-rich cell wall structural protein [Drosophila miranda]|uniref:glycine-rich cell wall structural protein n=1 Tax=Drosophila miranda TaxID=7229 RepID=UPI0007E775F0|nr:glycine-rich cell wall structural protein [Drosophila miranda]